MRRILGIIAVYTVAIAGLSAMAYGVISLVVNTGVEREFIAQNRMYARLYPRLEEREALIRDVVKDLQYRDEGIYNDIFHSPAPVLDPTADLDLSQWNDTVPEQRIASDVYSKAVMLSQRAGKVEENFADIFYALASRKAAVPPMRSPLEGVRYAQIGASVGMKTNPSYKTSVQHNGIDIMAAQGTPVLATAPGVVITIRRSSKGSGNEVEILHNGQYVTRYSHLASVYVGMRQRVSAGSVIGSVGMTGVSFAPHLHYEVRKAGEIMNPANYMFASFTPYDYPNVLYMASNTLQSMD